VIIQIDDSLSGKERRKLIEIYTIEYAYSLYKKQRDVANFLGIAVRCLRDRINRHEVLHKYKGYDLCKCSAYYDKMRRYSNAKLWGVKYDPQ
jgi:hypothetical protein